MAGNPSLSHPLIDTSLYLIYFDRTRPSPAQHLLCYAPNRTYNMPYDNGSPPDDIAAAAGEVLTEIGGGTSATATASSLGETLRDGACAGPTSPESYAPAQLVLEWHRIAEPVGSPRELCREGRRAPRKCLKPPKPQLKETTEFESQITTGG